MDAWKRKLILAFSLHKAVAKEGLIKVKGDTTIKLDIEPDDLDEGGNITIIALDDENLPLGSYDIQVKSAEDVVVIPDAGDAWDGFVSVIIWILAGIVGVGIIGGLFFIIFKRRRRMRNKLR